MNIVELIIRKRDGGTLSGDAIHSLVDAYVRGDVPDYQMSSLLMACVLRGLDEAETAALTDAMLHSGSVFDGSGIPGPKLDKHSTGGVSDNVSLILAPLGAVCGLVVPMISGRGLGHTGGTLDKLESIPGFRTDLSLAAMERQLRRLGVAMIGQTDEIAPADRGLYALRDVTGTVESIPLIAASIMSKKLAEGLDGLVLDVKFGSGAFMRREDDARRLAETLVDVGERNGCRTTALLTAMDAPLGKAVGNWLEVVEALDCLRGEGPAELREVTVALAAEMLVLGSVAANEDDGRRRAERALDDGSAYERFLQIVEEQGGDVSTVSHPEGREGSAPVHDIVWEGPAGWVSAVDARMIGVASVAMGAGRARKEDDIDPLAGITLNKMPGDAVGEGEVLASLHGSDTERARGAEGAVRRAFSVEFSRREPAPLVQARFREGQWFEFFC